MTSFLRQNEGILIVFLSTKFQRARGCNYGIPRLSQNKMKGLYRVSSGLENLEVSGNFDVRRKSQGKVKQEKSGKVRGILLCKIHFQPI